MSAASPRAQSTSNQPRADWKVSELAALVRSEGLKVNTSTGGPHRRTKADIVADIFAERDAAARTPLKLADLKLIISRENLQVKTNTGGPRRRTKADILNDIEAARKMKACHVPRAARG